ncbi:hydroxyacid dehydrogenase, mycelia-enriched transcript [Histoplasma capsulatum]|uniref:Hydroxyacid dehydrogenase, mycelia-enriched transcript n=1 Tax=Ajellomyces capsulatus TaxID=5037 RepID=A0A8A1MJE1_AJECA|nr:hydroxyacid dehydrogenase, mycelia-enriched transcript [Histoplasma capsulatum]
MSQRAVLLIGNIDHCKDEWKALASLASLRFFVSFASLTRLRISCSHEAKPNEWKTDGTSTCPQVASTEAQKVTGLDITDVLDIWIRQQLAEQPKKKQHCIDIPIFMQIVRRDLFHACALKPEKAMIWWKSFVFCRPQVTGPFDAELLNALPRSLRFICHNGAGYDNIDIATCTQKGIAVSNTPQAVNDATANTAIFLMLGALRKFYCCALAIRLVADHPSGKWRGETTLGHDPQEKVLGILGMGGIGTVASVGLDVYEHEPKIEKDLRDHPRAFLLPHIGTFTHETQKKMELLVLRNLESCLKGANLVTRVPEQRNTKL